jgi:hypothetical protein
VLECRDVGGGGRQSLAACRPTRPSARPGLSMLWPLVLTDTSAFGHSTESPAQTAGPYKEGSARPLWKHDGTRRCRRPGPSDLRRD